MNKVSKQNISYIGLILLGAIARLLPHAPNFTPTGSIAFFGGSKLSKPLAYLIPLAILAASDLIIGWHTTMLYVYGSFLVTVALGQWLRGSTAKTFAGLALSSVIFFFITNFGVWLGSGMYPQNASGLAACYIAALPFLANDFAATLIYGGAFFAAASLIEKKINSVQEAAA